MLGFRDIGQLFLFGFTGRECGADLSRMMDEMGAGGLVHFARNIGDQDETTNLNRDIQQVAARLGLPPLFIALDQEGGTVARLHYPHLVFPSNMASGAVHCRDPVGGLSLLHRAARNEAYALSGMGFNMNLAPCLDVNTNPANPVIGVRSFGDNPEAVSELGAARVLAYESTGVIPVAKHFPGHGDTHMDSHLGLPSVTWDSRFEARHVLPFQVAIEAGVPAIMTAHIVLQPGNTGGAGATGTTGAGARSSNGLPVTLSRDILTGYLRGVLRHKGLIITDCMEMAAIRDRFGTARACVMALQAGADLVLVSHTRELQVLAINAVAQALEDESLDEREVRAKLRRIQVAKALFLQASQSYSKRDNVPSVTPDQVADLSITLLRQAFRPATAFDHVRAARAGGAGLAVVAPRLLGSRGNSPDFRASPLGSALIRRGLSFDYRLYSPDPSGDEASLCSSLAASSGITLLVTFNAHLREPVLDLARRVLAASPTVALLMLGAPYDIMSLPDARYALCSYGYAPCQIESLVSVLVGETQPRGVLPVEIPGLYRRGYGLDNEGRMILKDGIQS